MKQILVITEKPSVAMSVGKVIGANERKDGYLQRNVFIAETKIFTRQQFKIF